MSEKIVQLNEEVIKVVLTIMNVPEFMVSFWCFVANAKRSTANNPQ